jgi:hypothetical protein
VDAQELSILLNEIIARGGTTALEDPFEPHDLASAMLSGPDVIRPVRCHASRSPIQKARCHQRNHTCG